MPCSTIILAKSFAAVVATGLGAVGGFSYVTGGSSSDFTPHRSPTSISSVAATYSPARLADSQESPQTESPSAETPELQIDLSDPSACLPALSECELNEADGAAELETNAPANEG